MLSDYHSFFIQKYKKLRNQNKPLQSLLPIIVLIIIDLFGLIITNEIISEYIWYIMRHDSMAHHREPVFAWLNVIYHILSSHPPLGNTFKWWLNNGYYIKRMYLKHEIKFLDIYNIYWKWYWCDILIHTERVKLLQKYFDFFIHSSDSMIYSVMGIDNRVNNFKIPNYELFKIPEVSTVQCNFRYWFNKIGTKRALECYILKIIRYGIQVESDLKPRNFEYDGEDEL